MTATENLDTAGTKATDLKLDDLFYAYNRAGVFTIYTVVRIEVTRFGIRVTGLDNYDRRVRFLVAPDYTFQTTEH